MEFAEIVARFGDEIVEERDGVVVHCPAHSDSKPSLRIAAGTSRLLLKCRAGCATKDVLAAVGLTFADLSGVTLGEGLPRATSTDEAPPVAEVAAMAKAVDDYAEALWTPEGERAREYAKRRFGLDDDALARLRLGYANLDGGPRLVVPFRDEHGHALGFQARALWEDARVRWSGLPNPSSGSWAKVAFLPGDSGWSEVVVTEGPGDGLASAGVGFDSIGVRGAGLATNPAVAREIARMVGDRPVVVFGDDDASGREFARVLAGALSKHGVSVVGTGTPDHGDLSAWQERSETFSRDFPARVATALQAAPSSVVARLDVYTEADLTDSGQARRLLEFVRQRGSDLRFSPEVGFHILDGGVWRADRLDEVRTLAQDAALALWQDVEEIEGQVADLPDDAPERGAVARRIGRLKTFARHANTTRGIDSAIRECQALRGVAVDFEAFDAHPDLLAVANGVVDLRTGTLLPPDPSLLLTRRIACEYHADASAPRWERFLDEVFPSSPDLPDYVRRLVGYGITGRTDEQAFAVLWGTGANGKSVFTDTLTEVFREITVTTPFSTFEERQSGGIPNDLAALKGARLVMAAEGERGRPMAEAVLKRVTGRDSISARFMRKEFFEFRPSFLLLLATNYKPEFRGQDEGLWRRVKLLPWERYFAPDERDHRLGSTLLSEREGILAWAVRGAVDWYASGLGDPPVVTGATSEYRETSDALHGFLPGVFVVDHDAGRVSGKVLFDSYLDWCDEENLPARERWTRRQFFSALEERGLVKRKTKTGVAFDFVRRARQVDGIESTSERSETPVPAHSSTEALPTNGPSLADVI